MRSPETAGFAGIYLEFCPGLQVRRLQQLNQGVTLSNYATESAHSIK